MRKGGAMQTLVDFITPVVEDRLNSYQIGEYASTNEVLSQWPIPRDFEY